MEIMVEIEMKIVDVARQSCGRGKMQSIIQDRHYNNNNNMNNNASCKLLNCGTSFDSELKFIVSISLLTLYSGL